MMQVMDTVGARRDARMTPVAALSAATMPADWWKISKISSQNRNKLALETNLLVLLATERNLELATHTLIGSQASRERES